MPRIDDEIRATAARCRHEATRKINHLATGLCPSGPEGHFAGFSPQGRKDITEALAGLLKMVQRPESVFSQGRSPKEGFPYQG